MVGHCRKSEHFRKKSRPTHAGGKWRWIPLWPVALQNEQGHIRGWVGMNADITGRRLAVEKLRLADQRKPELRGSQPIVARVQRPRAIQTNVA